MHFNWVFVNIVLDNTTFSLYSLYNILYLGILKNNWVNTPNISLSVSLNIS